MSISDTQSAKKYASIAEVAAAQAKMYALELENAPDYASEAQAAATAAAASSDTASQYASNAATAAASASSSANDAANSAAEAAAAAGGAINQTVRAPTGESLTALPAAASRINQFIVTGAAGDVEVMSRDSVPVLDSSGKLPVSVIPAIALTEPFVVNSEAAMLALDAQPGDIAKRTDLGYSFCLAASPASILSNWVQLTDDVLAQLGLSSGATQVGATSLSGASSTVQAELNKKPDSTDLAASTGAAAIGAATDAGTTTTVQGALALKVAATTLSGTGAGQGSNIIGYKSALSGAVARTIQSKFAEFLSVKDFGVVGDGATDDTSAFQTALNSGSKNIHIPAGTTIYLSSDVTLPAGSFSLSGDGNGSVITGPASTLLKFAATPSSGFPVTEIYGIKFVPTSDDAIHIDMTSVWSSAGKPPHIVRDCYFQFSGTGQIGIRMSGIWAARITDNTFIGAGVSDAKSVNTGYGIKTLHTDDMNSSVMNVQILSNTFTILAYPIFLSARTLLTGGRCEGVKISGNNCVNGIASLTANQTLAMSVTGNQMSDFANAILMAGCFDCAITGNSEITGDVNCIYLSSTSESFCERISITGNTINVQEVGATGIRISNSDGTSYCRNLTIATNDLRGTGTDTTYGVYAAGSYAITNVVVNGNNFVDHSYGVFFGGIDTEGANSDWDISGNGFSLNSGGVAVRFPERMSPRIYYRHSATSTFTATASQTSVSIDVSAAGFLEVPVYASAELTTQSGVRLVYSYDTSTTTTLEFNIVGTIPAGSVRYVLDSAGESNYGY